MQYFNLFRLTAISAWALAFAFSANAQISHSELAGKYHLQGQCNLWDNSFANLVTPHDDFTFNMTAQDDGTFRLSNFFYSGMDANWTPLAYSATARYSAAEGLLYVYPAEWMWDEYMGTFMDPYSHDPMLYFLVQKDGNGNISLTTTPNSLGFYVMTNLGDGNKFYYAIDYPGEVRATKLQTFSTVSPTTIAGDYDVTYTDFDGRSHNTTFTINRQDSGFTLTGMFGDKEEHPLYFEPDGKGVYANLLRKVDNNGRYTYYYGGVVGECRVSFSFDADGRLVSDNYITYTPDWRTWYDALTAVATKKGQAGIAPLTVPQPDRKAYNLNGRPAGASSSIVIRDGRKVIQKH